MCHARKQCVRGTMNCPVRVEVEVDGTLMGLVAFQRGGSVRVAAAWSTPSQPHRRAIAAINRSALALATISDALAITPSTPTVELSSHAAAPRIVARRTRPSQQRPPELRFYSRKGNSTFQTLPSPGMNWPVLMLTMA